MLPNANSPLAAEGLPWIFARFQLFGHGRDYEPDRRPGTIRRNEMPADDMVLSVP